MFTELKHKIHQSTADREFFRPRKVSRTFFFLVSPVMSSVKKWVEEFFPVPEEISTCYPWLLSKQGDSFQNEVEGSVRAAFEAKRMEEITLRGFSILDSVNQVIVIADLCDRDVCAQIVNGCKIIKNAIDRIIDPKTPVYWTAIFTLRSPQGQETVKEEGKNTLSPVSNVLDKICKEEFPHPFHRIFLLDISNPQGTLISDPKDQYCLIGHLLYFLSTYPLITESPDQYNDWLVKTEEEGPASGFSAFSLVLPVNQILEAVALFKGAQVMKESLLTGQTVTHYPFYLNNFLQKNRLLELEEVKRALSEDSDFPLKDPLSHLPDFFTMRPEDYVETVNALDASLPNTAKENEETMGKIGEKRLREWKESLEDHLEAMIGQEPGGLLVAKKFLQELGTHLEKLVSEQVKLPQYNDPAPCISDIHRLNERGPRREAIYGRALTLAVVSEAGVSSLPVALVGKVSLLIGLPLLAFALAAFYSYSNRQKMENQILKLERLLREKWRVLFDTGKRKVAKRLLEDFLKTVKQLQIEVDGALSRVTELVRYFQDEYIPVFPEDYAFRKFIVKEREELLRNESLCKTNVFRAAADYVERDRPLRLWRRLSPSGNSLPNEWEQRIMEMAAVRILPDCGDIVNLHILAMLQKEQEKFERFKTLIIRGIQPFVILRPGMPSGELNAVLDTEPKENQPVVGKLMNGLSGHFHNIRQFGLPSPYRLSVFGFRDGIKVDDILIR